MKFIYECRNCNEVYSEGVTSNELASQILTATVCGMDMPKSLIGCQPKMLSIHICNISNQEGVADLIGIWPDTD